MSDEFGCEHCWPADADAAWEARSSRAHVEELIDESHFHVQILACPHCTQRFLSAFAETVDWADSEDPQYTTVMPVTGPEARDLIRQRETLTDAMVCAIGPGRRCLRHDFPKGQGPRNYCASGMLVGPHD
jgi:uncharacterized protein YbaR (Trm112 family)